MQAGRQAGVGLGLVSSLAQEKAPEWGMWGGKVGKVAWGARLPKASNAGPGTGAVPL